MLFFTPDETVLALPGPTRTVSGTLVRLQYAGANQNPTLSGQNQLPGVVNYLIGNNSAKWQTNLPTYAGVDYDSLYTGITLRYDGTDGVLKSSYTVAPGAAPAQIRWRYQGATDVRVDAATGDLIIQLPPRGGQVGRTLTEHAPRAWQDIGGQRIPVSARFVVDSNKTVGFALGSYDTTQALTIDPVLTYSTFLGGSADDEGHAIAVDASGAAYVAGFTVSSNFPTASPRQGTSGGGSDAFVAKLSQPTVQLSAATLSVSEAAGSAAVNVTLSAAAPVPVTVNYATSNGTATAGSDYTAQSGTLTFAPSQTSQSISVPISDDNIDEPNETFSIALSTAVGARLGTPNSTTVTITDDDPVPTVSWQAANISVNEAAGSALVSAVLSNPAAATITVHYATSNGTATAGSDYTTTSGTFTFAPGVTSQSATVPILNDAAQESNETVNLTLSSPTNATLGAPNPATLTIVDDETLQPPSDEVYTYDQLGNLLSKAGTSYSYGANGNGTGAGPHQARTVGGAAYQYDANGNLLSGGGRTYAWDHENRPTSVSMTSGTESYSYDADGERITRSTAVTTTVYLGGLWEETSAGATKAYYTFGGQTIAVRDSSEPTDPVSYLHGDHLGSVSVASGAGASTKGSQRFDPWGKVIAGGISNTRKNYTGQYLDTTSLLYYHARYYDPALARFLSADSIIPGQDDKTGTPNPQNLNRYSYVGNNPLTRTDPTGHDWDHFVQFAIGVGEGAVNTIVGAVESSTPQGAMRAGAQVGAAIGSDPAGFVQGVKDWGANIVRGGEFAWNDPSGAAAALYEDSRGLGRVMGTTLATAGMAALGPEGETGAVCSFSGNTLVATESGEQPISSLQVGDHVLAYNQATGDTGTYTITAVLVHRDPAIQHLVIDGEDVETTPEHPFYVSLRGWVAAGDLMIGDRIRTSQAEYGAVQASRIELHSQEMYNLTVATVHTFFVGRQQWLVHNACPKGILKQLREPGPFSPTAPSKQAALEWAQEAFPDAMHLPDAQPNAPYPSTAGYKKWYRFEPAEPNVGNNMPHVKYTDWTGGKKGTGGSWGHIFFPDD